MPHTYVQMLSVMELLNTRQPDIGSALNVPLGLNTYQTTQRNYKDGGYKK